MKLPRDLTGQQLAKSLRRFGYEVTRQSGSHLRITTQLGGEHHEVIPNHSPIKVGTLQNILKNISTRHGISLVELVAKLDL